MKKGWEKRFDARWFAKPEETTIMNWEGLFKDESMGNYLKTELANIVKEFIYEESK